MAGYVGKTDNHFPIREGLPVKIVAASIVGGTVPTGNLISRNVRCFLRQQRLLDGARYLKVVLQDLEVALCLCLAKSCLDVLTGLSRNGAGNDTSDEKSDRIQADAGLCDRRRNATNGRSPPEVQGGTNVAAACDDP